MTRRIKRAGRRHIIQTHVIRSTGCLFFEGIRADKAESGDIKYSIKSGITDNNGNTYDNVVVLDTDIFEGVKTRDWGKVLYEFVYNNLVGKQVTVFDETQSKVTIEFAKANERVQKDGAKNSHKVIDKLSRKKDLNSRLAVAHADELITVSKTIPNQSNEHNHQWLDENGWSHRIAIIMKRDGTLLSANLNVAHSKDGRDILYDINKITTIGHGAVPSNSNKSRGSHIKTNNGKNNIPQSTSKSNSFSQQNSDRFNDTDYLSAVERGDMKTAQKMVDEAAKAAGYTSPKLYHGTKNFGFTEFDLVLKTKP